MVWNAVLFFFFPLLPSSFVWLNLFLTEFIKYFSKQQKQQQKVYFCFNIWKKKSFFFACSIVFLVFFPGSSTVSHFIQHRCCLLYINKIGRKLAEKHYQIAFSFFSKFSNLKINFISCFFFFFSLLFFQLQHKNFLIINNSNKLCVILLYICLSNRCNIFTGFPPPPPRPVFHCNFFFSYWFVKFIESYENFFTETLNRKQ